MDRLVLDYVRICHSLDQQGSLPEDAITDVLKGLSLASHEGYAKLFNYSEITLKNPLLNVNLEGTVIYQIVEVVDTVLTQYMPYSSMGQWMASLKHHANKISTPPPGFKCDNFGDPHFMNQFPKDFDDECITCNHKACVALPSNRRGVGGRGNGGGGRGGVGGRGGGGGRCRCGSRGRGRGRGRSRSRSRGRGRGRICGGNYVQGNFSSPAVEAPRKQDFHPSPRIQI